MYAEDFGELDGFGGGKLVTGVRDEHCGHAEATDPICEQTDSLARCRQHLFPAHEHAVDVEEESEICCHSCDLKILHIK